MYAEIRSSGKKNMERFQWLLSMTRIIMLEYIYVYEV